MTRKVHVVLHDDLTGEERARTVRFSLESRAYEIDLTEANAARLRDVLAPWIAAARKAPSRIPEQRNGGSRPPAEPAEIRRWAAENGIPVHERGRISDSLRMLYDDAH